MFPLYDDNPTRHLPILTVTLILSCIAVFLWQLSLGNDGQRIIYSFGAIPAILFDYRALPPDLAIIPSWVTPISSMFLHGGWMHLIGNMLYLWIFGNNVEDAMGMVRFILFYLICGLVALLTHALAAPESTIPTIGASGAISGVLGAYLLLYPRARVLVFIPLGFFFHTTRLPAALVLGFWFVLQLINQMGADAGQPGVAWGAHVGGFIAGIILVPFMRRKGVRLFAPAHRQR